MAIACGRCSSPSASWSGTFFSLLPAAGHHRALSQQRPGQLRQPGAHRVPALRSATYIAGLAVLSAVAVEVGRDRHAAMVPLFLGAIGALGIAFFLALMLASSDQINLVLVCWAATFVVLAPACGGARPLRPHRPAGRDHLAVDRLLGRDRHPRRHVPAAAHLSPQLLTTTRESNRVIMSTTIAITGADGFIGSHSPRPWSGPDTGSEPWSSTTPSARGLARVAHPEALASIEVFPATCGTETRCSRS